MSDPRSPIAPQDSRSPIAKALDLVSQITSIGLTAVVPALGGYYLDGWLETKLVFVILGLALGLITAGLQLYKLVKKLEQNNA